jgi:hypothetical protein
MKTFCFKLFCNQWYACLSRKQNKYTKNSWIFILIIFLLPVKIYAVSGLAWCIILHVSLIPVETTMASGLSGILKCTFNPHCLFLWQGGLRRGSAAARLLGYWEFHSRRERRCLFLVNVVCCQVDVSATGRSLVQRSRTRFGVPKCHREASIMRGLGRLGAVET